MPGWRTVSTAWCCLLRKAAGHSLTGYQCVVAARSSFVPRTYVVADKAAALLVRSITALGACENDDLLHHMRCCVLQQPRGRLLHQALRLLC